MDGLSIADKLKAMHGTSKSSRRGRTTVSGTGLQTGATGDYSGAKEEQAGHERVIPPQLPKQSRTERGSAPVELSSQSRAPKTWGGFRASAAAQGGRVRARDPRFDEAAGELKPGKFRQAYGFLVDQLETDISDAKKRLKQAKTSERRGEIQVQLRELQQQRGAQRLIDAKRDATTQWMDAQRERVRSGHAPTYLGKRERAELETAARYRLLRDEAGGGTGGAGGAGDAAVRRAIRKRREKTAKKDKRRLGEQGAAVLGAKKGGVRGGGGAVGGDRPWKRGRLA